MTHPIEQRLSEWVAPFNLRIRTLDERPDRPEGDPARASTASASIVYLVKDVFTTRNGSFDPAADPGAIPQWARDAYLSPDFLEAGANHHLFGRVIGLDGAVIKGHTILYWSDGFEKLGDPAYQDYVRAATKESSGWANQLMSGGSGYDPAQGQAGPWCWAPVGAAEVICGGGLPNQAAISTFVVWQAVRREDLGVEPAKPEPPIEPPPVEPPVEPPPVEPPTEPEKPPQPPTPPPTPTITRRLGDWVERLNLRTRTLAERPDQPAGDTASASILYLVKDIFTTRDGSWEPSAHLGSVNQWALDAYLKPFGAPDYFDDAGADHHLFAAVIGLDGQLLRDQEIQFWSDGFDKLGDPAYADYVFRRTKTRSGWANIVTGPSSNYIVERGESGPWCWAPVGASEVVCGGGMPAKQHISMFVVWQALRRSDVEKPTPPPPFTGGDHNIFLPFVTGGARPIARNTALAPAADVAFPLAAAVDLARLRSAAWNRLDLEYRPDSPLAEYARRNALGKPVTQEFVVGNLLVQGFDGGIVFAPLDDSKQVGHVSW